MPKKLRMVLAIITLFFSEVSPTNATAIASIDITEFKIELRDLDLNDGISPNITFQGAPVNTIYFEQKSNNPYYWSYGNIFHGDNLFASISNSLTNQSTYGEVNITGSPYIDNGMSIYSTAIAYGSLGESTFSNAGMFLSTSGAFEKFIISENTELLISAIIKLSSYAYPNEKPNHKEFAYTYVEFSLKGDFPSGDYQNDTESQSTFAGLDTDTKYDSFLGGMTISFINSKSSVATGYLYGAVTTESYSNAGETKKIDEPESAFLIVTGTFLLIITQALHKKQKS